ncbi:MAG: hypothetical protein F6K47_29560 [Symploca sp. SIO2E6]|nr:hypothetical protein [Symploca sp. SIO2E6]
MSALLSWSISHLLIDILPIQYFLPNFPLEIIILTIATPIIAAGIVVAEVFLSNPTRIKANWRVLSRSSLKAVFTFGLIAGLILSLLNWLLTASQWPSILIRLISWALIGSFAGIAESLSWGTRSIEGSKARIQQRIIQSTGLGTGSGLVAAVFYEIFRPVLGWYDEFFGFLLLGSILGLALCFAASPSYHFALRAGQGFEAVKPKPRGRTTQLLDPPRPELNNPDLKFIPDNDGMYEHIEEGLSIQLPTTTPQRGIQIGSGNNSDIYIPHIPEDCAVLSIRNGNVELRCRCEKSVQVQRQWVSQGRKVTLRHNQMVTLYHESDCDKFYRFIFYNRFLDPQA